jgi:LmbE family N-acetylglucosaminyl deacetylase
MKNLLKELLIRFYILWIKCISGKVIVNYSQVLVLAPHPDDEILGLGGLILQMIEKKCNVYIVYLTDGEGSNSHPEPEEIRKNRLLLSETVLSELNIPKSNIYRLHLEDGKVPRKGLKNFNETVLKIKDIIETVKPEAVFATHYLESWPYDHLACFELTSDAVSKLENKPELWLYWVWTWHHMRPWKLLKTLKSQIIDITQQSKKKEKLIDSYLVPKSPTGIPWSGNLPTTLIIPLKQKFETIEKYKSL